MGPARKRIVAFPLAACALWALSLCGGPLAEESVGTGGSPLPDDDARAANLKLVQAVYKDDYARANSPPEKLAFARKLLAAGRSTANDAAARYVLLIEAGDFAVEAGEASVALESVDEIARRYLAVNALDLKAETLEKVARAVRTAEGARDLTAAGFELVEESLRVNNLAAARRIATLAAAAAGKAKSKHLAAWAAFLPKRLAELEKEYAAAKQAADALRRQVDDPVACLTAGRFRALLKDEWEAGLDLLKRSGDASLKAIAEKELGGMPPGEMPQGESASGLGDLWLSASERLLAPFKAPAQARAVHWYAAAASSLEGLARAKVMEKLARLGGGSTQLKPGLMAELFDGRQLKRRKSVRIDAQVDFDWGKGAPEKDVPANKFSVRWTGKLKVPRPGRHILVLNFDDAARLWIDGELLVDRWATSPGREQVTVWLTDKPHAFRLDYNDWTSDAVVRLRWSPPGDSRETPVPPHAFFHDAEDERQARR